MLKNFFNYLFNSKKSINKSPDISEIIESNDQIVNNLELHLTLTICIVTLCTLVYFILPKNKKEIKKCDYININMISKIIKLNIYNNIIIEREKNMNIMFELLKSRWDNNMKVIDWMKSNLDSIRPKVLVKSSNHNLSYLILAHLIICNYIDIDEFKNVVSEMSYMGKLYMKEILYKFECDEYIFEVIDETMNKRDLDNLVEKIIKTDQIALNMEYGDRNIMLENANDGVYLMLENLRSESDSETISRRISEKINYSFSSSELINN